MDASLAASLLLAHATDLARAGDYDRAHPLTLSASIVWSKADDELEFFVRQELLAAGLDEVEVGRRLPRARPLRSEGDAVDSIRPFVPYFGSKWDVAPVIWDRLGNVPNFLDAFSGGCSVAFRRPHVGKVETLNDLHGFIPNALRALRWAPEAVAEECSWIGVSELDLHARHADLMERLDEAFVERLRSDPKFYDVELAAWWISGQSQWIGSGFCDTGHRNAATKMRPALSGAGKRPALSGHGGDVQRGDPKAGVGIFRGTMPSLAGSDGTGVGYGRGIFASGRREDLYAYFRAIQARLGGDRAHNVRITCHDAIALLTPAVTTSHGLTGVVLDPPYSKSTGRRMRLYGCESGDVAAQAREWAIANGDNPHLRIVLAGYVGEHDMPPTWECYAWRARGGYGNQGGENENAGKERLWFSPHCLGGRRAGGPLFDRVNA